MTPIAVETRRTHAIRTARSTRAVAPPELRELAMPYFDIDAFEAVVDPIAGVERRFIHTESMSLAVISFKAGTTVPRHAHPNEQISLVASGLFELAIGGDTRRLRPGGCGLIPENISHAARAVEDSVVIEIFSPKRENFG